MLCAWLRMRCLSSLVLSSARLAEGQANRTAAAIIATFTRVMMISLFISFGSGGFFIPSLHVDSFGKEPCGKRSFAEQAADGDERRQIMLEREGEKSSNAIG